LGDVFGEARTENARERGLETLGLLFSDWGRASDFFLPNNTATGAPFFSLFSSTVTTPSTLSVAPALSGVEGCEKDGGGAILKAAEMSIRSFVASPDSQVMSNDRLWRCRPFSSSAWTLERKFSRETSDLVGEWAGEKEKRWLRDASFLITEEIGREDEEGRLGDTEGEPR
jgi:hypothetical protein